MAVPGVILDLDGTMVDSNYLHVVAWWQAFREHGLDVCTADVHQLLGRPSGELVAELAAAEPEDRRRAVVSAHTDRYAPFLDRLRATPGAGALMRELRDRGLRVVVCTSANPDEVAAMLAATGAADTVHTIVDSGDATNGKPSPDPMILAMERGNLDQDRTVVLGDAVWDVQSARAAGLRCVALTCGGIDACRLTDAGAEAVHDHPARLLDRLCDSPLGALLPRAAAH